MNTLPNNSKMNELHSDLFKTPAIYLYGYSSHLTMGMLDLIIVGNDFHNLEKIEFSYVVN